MRLVVTTPLGAGSAEEIAAREAAERHALAYAPRRERSLAAVARSNDADALLVVGPRRVSLWHDGVEAPWHAGMGDLRLRRVEAGEQVTRDTFLEAAALRSGDRVLDATLGLGMDALVAASVVGPEGAVVGVESSRPLAALVAEGLRRHPSEASRRIEVVCADATTFLVNAAPASFDVVVFDPMFRYERAAQDAFDVVRRLASPAPLAPETLARARAVARRHVLVKDGAPGWDLARLGLQPLPSARGAKRLYARLDAAPL